MPDPGFAADAGTARYYDRRAGEYDEWYLGEGRFAERDRPGWSRELAGLVAAVGNLPSRPTMDVACGTGFLSRHVPGLVLALDQSQRMAAIAASRIAPAPVVVGDALRLPVRRGALDRVFTGHFYGHLPPAERAAFLAEAWRVAGELVVVDSAARAGEPSEEWQERVLNDGSRHRVFKRYLGADELAREIGGAPLLAGRWFVAAAASRPGSSPG